MPKRKQLDPSEFAATSRRHAGKIVERPDVVEWIRDVIEAGLKQRANGGTVPSYSQIAVQLSDEATDPYLKVTEAGVRHHVREKHPDLYAKIRGDRA